MTCSSSGLGRYLSGVCCYFSRRALLIWNCPPYPKENGSPATAAEVLVKQMAAKLERIKESSAPFCKHL